MLHKTHFLSEDECAVGDVIQRGDMVASLVVQAFERRIAALVGRKYCVATNTGTAALMAAINYRGARWFPTLTYAATLSAGSLTMSRNTDDGFVAGSLYDNVSPVPPFRNTYDGVVGVDLFGLPCDLSVDILDACESLGTLVDGEAAARRGGLACLSFNANKILTTGQGGAVVTDDEGAAMWIRQFINQGKGSGHFKHVFVGINGRMNPMSAALGLSQLSRFDDTLRDHARVHTEYFDALYGLDGIDVQLAPDKVKWNHWLVVAQVEDPLDRDVLVAALNAVGIEARPCFPCLHLEGPWADPRRSFPGAEDYSARTLLLPSGVMGHD
jgi:perosamine synthetase